VLLARILTTSNHIYMLRNEHGAPIRSLMPRGAAFDSEFAERSAVSEQRALALSLCLALPLRSGVAGCGGGGAVTESQYNDFRGDLSGTASIPGVVRD